MLHLTIHCSHNSQGAEITQIAFSPRDNLVAWSDKQGGFTRWPKPIPDNLPSPVKPATGPEPRTTNGAEVFYDAMTPDGDPVENDGDFDAHMDDFDDGLDDPNFVIDDLGIGLRDEPEPAKHDGYVKEMG
jgi:chromosome transmission fidelity protein 4